MSYVDGFVIPVPTAKKQEYRDNAPDMIYGGFEIVLDAGSEAGR